MDPTQPSGWNQAIKTGTLLFIAGQVAMSPKGKVVGVGDIKAQVTQAFENMKAILKQAGATFGDIVYIMGFYAMSIDEAWPVHRVIQQKYIKKNFPAVTCVQVTRLAKPEFLCEIEAIAVLDR